MEEREEQEEKNEMASDLVCDWLKSMRPRPLCFFSSPNTTESPTSPATSGLAGYIIAAIIVSQVITAREHPPRLLLGPGGGRGAGEVPGMSPERRREGGSQHRDKEKLES